MHASGWDGRMEGGEVGRHDSEDSGMVAPSREERAWSLVCQVTCVALPLMCNSEIRSKTLHSCKLLLLFSSTLGKSLDTIQRLQANGFHFESKTNGRS